MSKKNYYKQFDILKEIAVSSSSDIKSSDITQIAIKKTSEMIGLSAGALILWDGKSKPTISSEYFESEEDQEFLKELENNLFADLRMNRKLVSAYISFGGEKPTSGFTLPIVKGEEILGALIGIQTGKGSLVKEEDFLEALSAALSMAVLIGRMDKLIEKERFEAVMATATAVNHGINNPLQAALGIVQLLPKELPDLDERLMKKLQAIEESVLAITKITHKLMHISEIKYTDYIDGTQMLDLPEDTDSL